MTNEKVESRTDPRERRVVNYNRVETNKLRHSNLIAVLAKKNNVFKIGVASSCHAVENNFLWVTRWNANVTGVRGGIWSQDTEEGACVSADRWVTIISRTCVAQSNRAPSVIARLIPVTDKTQCVNARSAQPGINSISLSSSVRLLCRSSAAKVDRVCIGATSFTNCRSLWRHQCSDEDDQNQLWADRIQRSQLVNSAIGTLAFDLLYACTRYP